MSQPKNFTAGENDPLDSPLLNPDDLTLVFKNAERTTLLIGLEYEMFGQINGGLSPLPYEGPISITTLFKELIKKTQDSPDPFSPIYEYEHLVALSTERGIIALEPGGQLEIALKPYPDLSHALENFVDMVKIVHHAAQNLGIQLFALGIHPSASRNDMAQVKKSRYAIMRSYMEKLPGLGLDMMTRSCALQFNLDFINEQDMVKKTKMAAFLSPLLALLSSSVAFMDKRLASHAVGRGNVWRFTDPIRSGIPKIIFDENFGYLSWINYALDVPMYFIRRGSTYHPVFGASFRDFIKHGLLGFKPTFRDFVDHLTTIFTDIRLKPILELRSPDSLPVPFVNAFTALIWILFYDQQAFYKASVLYENISHKELINLRDNVIDQGRGAKFRGNPVFRLIEQLLDIARISLNDLAQKTNNSYINSTLLHPLDLLIEKNITCAEWIKNHFLELNNNNLPILLKAFDPLNNPFDK